VIQEFLRTVPLFEAVDDEELTQILLVALLKRYPEGAAIITEGTPGGRIHVIREGKVRISKIIPRYGEEALAILSPGEVFGEVEFFDKRPPSAHAFAHTACEILSVPHVEMAALLAARPGLEAKILWALGQTLARRLRDTNEKLASLFAVSRALP
jgi:CRP/FNR family transcriptional regulator, cyclic AMP receptor protein